MEHKKILAAVNTVPNVPVYAKPETIEKSIEEALQRRSRLKCDKDRAEIDVMINSLEAALKGSRSESWVRDYWLQTNKAVTK